MTYLIAIVTSIFAAAGIARLEVKFKMRPARLQGYDTIKNGVWTTNRRGEGSREALRIHRARIAKHTGFGMNRSEAIYWGTAVDSSGELLDCKNDYLIEGVDPDTRWWCLSVYQDFFFIPNEQDRYSISKTDVEREPDNSWTIRISATEKPGSWIPSGEATGKFQLVFRCYNPGSSMIEQGESIQLPRVIREEQ
ncbi:MAG: DUF1214 domain-containing protein [Deltaproteobacteria bacterium]|nr:DUF1214 domain-containing protein [Deltaproteobacteria bacterium]